MTIHATFNAHRGRQIDKWEHYFDIYEKHFAKYVNRSPRVLEIGVDHGGSLQMWKSYFGKGAEILGVDINPACKEYEEDQIQILIADQCKIPGVADLIPFDIIIDDGSHICAHQSITFRQLWPKCTGVYLIEDCHDGYPLLDPHPMISYRYPWVIVVERPHRIIRGKPSRELTLAELQEPKYVAEGLARFTRSSAQRDASCATVPLNPQRSQHEG
jgi:hypothetical protein